MCTASIVIGESSLKFVNGLEQNVRPFLSVVEDGKVFDFAVGVVIDGHDKVLSWRASVKGHPLIVFWRLVKMLEGMKSISSRDIEPCWHFCRTNSNLHDMHAKYIAFLKESVGVEDYEGLKKNRKVLLASGPSPSEYEGMIKKIISSNLSEGAKDYLIPLCLEGKEFYNPPKKT